MALTTYPITGPVGDWCLHLLYEEVMAVSGVYAVLMLHERFPFDKRVHGISLTFDVLSDVSDPAPMLQEVDNVLAAHVAIPGPGPVGMCHDEVLAAWIELGRQIAHKDAISGYFWLDGPTFYAQDLSSYTFEQVRAAYARAVYCNLRASGQVPPPPGYDPFNEGTCKILGDGSLEWTARGPPWT